MANGVLRNFDTEAAGSGPAIFGHAAMTLIRVTQQRKGLTSP
jgi:hypothetical protein